MAGDDSVLGRAVSLAFSLSCCLVAIYCGRWKGGTWGGEKGNVLRSASSSEPQTCFDQVIALA